MSASGSPRLQKIWDEDPETWIAGSASLSRSRTSPGKSDTGQSNGPRMKVAARGESGAFGRVYLTLSRDKGGARVYARYRAGADTLLGANFNLRADGHLKRRRL